jgi:hypothetical protein
MPDGRYLKLLPIRRSPAAPNVKAPVLPLPQVHIKRPENLMVTGIFPNKEFKYSFQQFCNIKSVIFAHLFRKTLLIP